MSKKKTRIDEDLMEEMDVGGGETDEEVEVVELRRKKPLPTLPKDKEEEESYSETYMESPIEQGVRKSTLQKLFDQEVSAEGMTALRANSEESYSVDKAFRNLESRLGNAGKRCIEAYHKWGRNFWGQPEKEVLLGLLNGYWHQVMISTGVRLNADRKEASKTKQVMLLPPLTEAMVTYQGPAASFPTPTSVNLDHFKSERSGNPLNVETGHFKSINHRIRRDAKMECREGNTLIGPCLVQPTEQYVAWAKLVGKVIGAWEIRKHLRAPKQILQLFQLFLLGPTLIHWNNLIGASVLWKTHDKFLQAHGDWMNENGSWKEEYAALGNFFNREIPSIYAQFLANDQLVTGYPTGYVGLVREMLIHEKNDAIWNGINALEAEAESKEQFLKASSMDNASSFYNLLKQADLKNVPTVGIEVQPDDLIRKRQSQAAKKAKKGEMESRVPEEQLRQVKNLADSGLLRQAQELRDVQISISNDAEVALMEDTPLDRDLPG